MCVRCVCVNVCMYYLMIFRYQYLPCNYINVFVIMSVSIFVQEGKKMIYFSLEADIYFFQLQHTNKYFKNSSFFF